MLHGYTIFSGIVHRNKKKINVHTVSRRSDTYIHCTEWFTYILEVIVHSTHIH